jgi:hypothetical protein
MRVLRSSSRSGVGWGVAPHCAHPHRTDRRQGEKHTSAEYVQIPDIGSTAWGWELISEGEPSHTRHGCMQAERTLGMSEGTACCPSFQLICTLARQIDEEGKTGFLRPPYHRVNQCE